MQSNCRESFILDSHIIPRYTLNINSGQVCYRIIFFIIIEIHQRLVGISEQRSKSKIVSVSSVVQVVFPDCR